MNDNLFPDDFFDGSQKPKSSNIKLAKQMIREKKMLPYVKITIEQSVFIAITALVLMVLSFAAGVERGKQVASKEAFQNFSIREDNSSINILPDHVITNEVIDISPLKETYQETPEEETLSDPNTTDENEDKKLTLDTATQINPTDTQIKILAKKPESAYIIMLVIYSDTDSANKETKKLRAEGHDAYYYENGNWNQVYSEGYSSIEEAKNDVTILKKRYSDCYIRKIKN
ncbi:MAG: SPOR domain-containing protein [Candidatus Omnitrophica bacterium]|nr:SPOR domain-containing protein [Candidatus Omnitrophota bacterium]